VGPRAGLDVLEKKKSLDSVGIQTLDHPHQVLVLVEVKASVCVSRNMHKRSLNRSDAEYVKSLKKL
jgi:hypothetical protein